MTIAVCYFSKSGNTRKVTEAVGDAIGVKARDLSWPFDRKMDVVFLGSGVYAGGVDEQVKNFLKRNADKIGVLVNVSTGAFGSSYKAVKKLAEELHISVKQAERLVVLHTGCTFNTALTNNRIRAAEFLMKTTSFSISEIANLVGYESHSGFWKAYKRYREQKK